MSQRICLMALIGLPGAGKSHLSRCLLNAQQLSFNVIHLCYDKFMEFSSSVDAEHNNYKRQREQILETLSGLLSYIQTNNELPLTSMDNIAYTLLENSRDYIILCDDNNYYASMRYKLYQLCRQYGLSYAQLHLKCPLSLCVTRNAARLSGERVPQHVLLQMAERLEIPKQHTNSWEESTLSLDVNDVPLQLEQVIEFLHESLSKNLSKVNLSVETSLDVTQSVVHRLDLLLRQRIRQLLKELGKHEDKAMTAQDLNHKRKVILLQMRQKLTLGASEEITEEALGEFVKLLN